MDAAAVIDSAPATLELGGQAGATSRLDERLVAIQGRAPESAEPVATFEGGEVVVTSVDTAPEPGKGTKIGPVYRQQAGGLAVPTGRVLVRFQPGEGPATHANELNAAGFKIDEVLPYAPHAAWLSPQDDEPVAALSRLDDLASLPTVEHVEFQVLTESAPRES
jgi:hypothetical protein